METFIQLVVSGIALGFIYGVIALSFVFVYKSSRIVNLPAPELATLSAFLALELLDAGFPYWGMFFSVVAIASVLGFVFHRLGVRRFQGGSPLRLIVVLFGVYFLIHGLMFVPWGGVLRQLETPFGVNPYEVLGVRIRAQDVGIVGVTLIMLTLYYLLFLRTKFGLGLRATAQNYVESQLNGIPADSMLAAGWAIGGGTAAVAGLMVAPVLGLSAEMMIPMLVYAFTTWIVGGVDSPAGAIVGGISIGLGENLIGFYVHPIGNDLKLPVVLLFLVLTLVIRPQGLWGTKSVTRV